MTISDGGTGSVRGRTYIGADTTASGTLNIDSASGDIAVAPEILDSSAIEFGVGSGKVVFNHTATDAEKYSFNAAISGLGDLYVYSGVTTLTALNTYTGATTVANGILKTGIAGAFSTDSAFTVNSGAMLDLDGCSQTIAGLSNSGIVQAGSSSSTIPVGTTLAVNGNYQSNGGNLSLRTVLGDDTSATDKLIVKGDTGGHTDVMITNLGGGAQTVNGIEVVAVDGNSAGTFDNSRRIVAGAYDYFVRSGKTIQGANDKNWYLISDIESITSNTSLVNTTPAVTETVKPAPAVTETKKLTPAVTETVKPAPAVASVNAAPVHRPENGGYLGNLAASNTLFVTQLHDRMGEMQYPDTLNGEEKAASVWMRHAVNHNSFRDSTGQLETSGSSYVMQIGGDLAQWSNNGSDRWHLGVMGGYAHNSGKSRSLETGHSAKGIVDGYSIGLYGTWYANQADKSGAYFDSWALYNWFDNEVSGEQLRKEKYKSKGITASIEGGYGFLLSKNDRASYWIQPKAQVIWMGVAADNHTEDNGTIIKGDADSNLMTRLGVRVYADVHSKKGKSKDYAFHPFVELNWIHNTNDYAITMDNVRIYQKGANNLGEARLGVEGRLSGRLYIWANVGHQFGGDSYSNTTGMFGVKYSF